MNLGVLMEVHKTNIYTNLNDIKLFLFIPFAIAFVLQISSVHLHS